MAGKKYKAAKEQIGIKAYPISEAIALAVKTSFTKFPGTINIAFKLGLDPKQADQQIRASIVLPHGTGKTKRVLVITKGPNVKAAQEAGAEHVGGAELLEKIKTENWFDFDIIVASPDMMPVLGKYGRLLGPKGLMPNPKTGTVSPNVKLAVENIKKGQVEYRLDKEANIHSVIGTTKFAEKKLLENYEALRGAIIAAKPAAAKGKYIQNITIAPTMGPGIKVIID